MMKTAALVRALPKSFAANALRSDPFKIIDQALAQSQHEQYCETLKQILGNDCVVQVPTRDEQPDSCFVEDTVVVLRSARQAIGLTPGAASRREESKDVWETLKSKCGIHVNFGQRPDEFLDGGDVLFTGMGYLVGLSERTSPMGAKRFKQLVEDLEHKSFVEFVKVPHGLHLKSICSICGKNTIVISEKCNRSFLEEIRKKTQGANLVPVPDPEAANCVWIEAKDGSLSKEALIIRQEFPRSTEILRAQADELGIQDVYELNMSEIAKADGALTCCSVLVELPHNFHV